MAQNRAHRQNLRCPLASTDLIPSAISCDNTSKSGICRSYSFSPFLLSNCTIAKLHICVASLHCVLCSVPLMPSFVMVVPSSRFHETASSIPCRFSLHLSSFLSIFPNFPSFFHPKPLFSLNFSLFLSFSPQIHSPHLLFCFFFHNFAHSFIL